MDRKPETAVEIIDECDEFLDTFSNQRTINIERLQNSLQHLYGEVKSVQAESSQTRDRLHRLPQVHGPCK